MNKDLHVYLDPDQMLDAYSAHGFSVKNVIDRIEKVLNETGIGAEITGLDLLNRIDFMTVHDKNLALITLLQPSYMSNKTGRQYYKFIG